MGGTIGIVLNPLYLCRNAILDTLEIDNTVMLFVPTTDMSSGNPAVVVTAAISGLVLQQGSVRRALVQILINHSDDMATTGGSGLTR